MMLWTMSEWQNVVQLQRRGCQRLATPIVVEHRARPDAQWRFGAAAHALVATRKPKANEVELLFFFSFFLAERIVAYGLNAR